jgi:hypothetical protein
MKYIINYLTFFVFYKQLVIEKQVTFKESLGHWLVSCLFIYFFSYFKEY